MDALVVDAFATGPMTGRPVVVLPAAELTADQYRAVRRELGADSLVVDEAGRLRAVGAGPTPGVAAGALVRDGGREPGAVTVVGERERTATLAADEPTWVEVASVADDPVDAGLTEVADALAVDEAALADVGADLPLARVTVGERAYLAVPVNFLEHLGGADPDREWVAGILDTVDAAALYAFTFDTLDADADFHARVFGREGERALSARGGVACAGYVRAAGAVDADRERFTAASGHYLDRPSRVEVDLAGPRVGGRAVTVFEGTVTVPEGDDDDIIEA
jgi:predicted PhzF superfamily epimerase YddE/YHI9